MTGMWPHTFETIRCETKNSAREWTTSGAHSISAFAGNAAARMAAPTMAPIKRTRVIISPAPNT